MKTYRAGIIGCARMGSWYDDRLTETPERIPSSHAGCYTRCERTELVAGCDLNEETLKAFGDKWGIEALYTDFRQMLEQESLDIVSIVTSWGHIHAQLAPVVAESGVNIFCEKPIATSMQEADRIVEACQKGNVKFTCAYLRRWNARYNQVKELIDAGAIGSQVLSITACGMGTLMHGGTHYLDIMAYLANDPEPDWGFGRLEDTSHLDENNWLRDDPPGGGYLEMKNGVRLLMEGVSTGPIAFQISGTDGKIILLNDGRDILLWTTSDTEGGRLVAQPVAEMKQPKSATLTALEELVTCIDDNKETSCSERHSAKALEMALVLHESHRLGGVRVNCPMENRQLSVDTW